MINISKPNGKAFFFFFLEGLYCDFEWQFQAKSVSQFSQCFWAPDNRRCFDNPVICCSLRLP